MRIVGLLLILASTAAADFPPCGRQLWPWPIGGNLTRGYVDADGFAWVGNNAGDVLRIDPNKVPKPSAYKMFHLADGFEIRAMDGVNGRLYAVGSLAGAGGAIYEFDGKRWKGVYVTAQGYANRFHVVRAFGPNDVWALGTSMTTGSACVRFDGSGWQRVPTSEKQYLSGLARLQDGSIWSGGVKDTLHRWDGKRWTVGRSVPVKYLWNLFPCGKRVYLQGSDAANHRGVWDLTEPEARRIQVPGNTADLSIAGVVGSSLYCVDAKKRLWKVTPERAVFVAENASASVTGLPDGRLLLSGASGLLAILDGSERIPCGVRGDYTALAYAANGEQCVAATKTGPFFIFDGQRVRLIPRPHRVAVTRIAMRSPDAIYAALPTGHIYRYDGRLWTRLTRDPLTETFRGGNHEPRPQPVRARMLYLPADGGLVVFPSMDCWDGKTWRRLKLPYDPYEPTGYVETGAVITHLPTYAGIIAIGGKSIATLCIETSEGLFERENPGWRKLDARMSFHRSLHAPRAPTSSTIRQTLAGLKR